MDCSPPGFSVHGIHQGKNTGVGCHALPQEIVPAQGSNPSLLNCWQILYCLIHQETVLLLVHGAVHGGSMLSIKVIFLLKKKIKYSTGLKDIMVLCNFSGH